MTETKLNLQQETRLNQHQCPNCGYYIWAHPVTVCNLSQEEAEQLYDIRIKEQRERVRAERESR